MEVWETSHVEKDTTLHFITLLPADNPEQKVLPIIWNTAISLNHTVMFWTLWGLEENKAN